MATLQMPNPWRDPRTGIFGLRARVPARYVKVAGVKGDVVKISTGTSDHNECVKKWPDVPRQWDAMKAE